MPWTVTHMARAARVAALAGLLLLATTAASHAELVRFRIDPDQSALTFKATSRLVNADGRFHRFGGEVTVEARDPTTARIAVTVEAASIDTGNAKRDNHLRSADFFWAERHPIVRFESVRVTPDGDALAVRGRLTIRGVTRDVTVPLTVSVDPERFEARGRFDVKRSEYEMNYQSFVNPVGDVVHVSFVFRGVRAAP